MVYSSLPPGGYGDIAKISTIQPSLPLLAAGIPKTLAKGVRRSLDYAPPTGVNVISGNRVNPCVVSEVNGEDQVSLPRVLGRKLLAEIPQTDAGVSAG